MLATTLRLCLVGFIVMAGCSGGGDSTDGLDGAKGGNGNGFEAAIGLTPSNFAFSVTQGDTSAAHTIDVSNIGNGLLDWSATASVSWLTLSPSSGKSSAPGPTPLTAMVNLSGLAAGTYAGTITVIGDDAVNSPQTIPVTLIISSAPSPPSTIPTTSTSAITSPTAPPSSTPPTATVSVGIAWDAIPLSVGGYYVHYGTRTPSVTGSCAYSESVYYSLSSLATASAPSATISGLSAGSTYYFAVSSYDGALQSPCSNEISRNM